MTCASSTSSDTHFFLEFRYAGGFFRIVALGFFYIGNGSKDGTNLGFERGGFRNRFNRKGRMNPGGRRSTTHFLSIIGRE